MTHPIDQLFEEYESPVPAYLLPMIVGYLREGGYSSLIIEDSAAAIFDAYWQVKDSSPEFFPSMITQYEGYFPGSMPAWRKFNILAIKHFPHTADSSHLLTNGESDIEAGLDWVNDQVATIIEAFQPFLYLGVEDANHTPTPRVTFTLGGNLAEEGKNALERAQQWQEHKRQEKLDDERNERAAAAAALAQQAKDQLLSSAEFPPEEKTDGEKYDLEDFPAVRNDEAKDQMGVFNKEKVDPTFIAETEDANHAPDVPYDPSSDAYALKDSLVEDAIGTPQERVTFDANADVLGKRSRVTYLGKLPRKGSSSYVRKLMLNLDEDVHPFERLKAAHALWIAGRQWGSVTQQESCERYVDDAIDAVLHGTGVGANPRQEER